MDNFTMAELGVFIGVVGGVLTSLILSARTPADPEPEPEPEPAP